MRLYNYELERHLIGGLLQFPEEYYKISSFISEKDFYSESSSINRAIFIIIKSCIEKNESIDEYLISEKVKNLGLSFEEGIDCLEYLQSLTLRKSSQSSLLSTAKEIKILTLKRDISQIGVDLQSSMKQSSLSHYQDIIDKADSIYNSKINFYESGADIPENIYENMEHMIEDRGENPVDDHGLEGPHQRLHEIYGSLLRPGNISVIVARSGIGKTQFCMDFCTKVSSLNENVPILHFDNGEMSIEELTMRQCAALSGVPLNLLESGRWRNAGEDVVKKVRSVWSKVKSMKFYYYNCGGMTVDDMVNTVKRFYYSRVGRGNQMILSFDYIKTTFQNQKIIFFIFIY